MAVLKARTSKPGTVEMIVKSWTLAVPELEARARIFKIVPDMSRYRTCANWAGFQADRAVPVMFRCSMMNTPKPLDVLYY
jgi:hypothetical protein